jgi:hypothetical protein
LPRAAALLSNCLKNGIRVGAYDDDNLLDPAVE